MMLTTYRSIIRRRKPGVRSIGSSPNGEYLMKVEVCRKGNPVIRWTCILLTVSGMLGGDWSYALPNLSMEYGQSCFLCHVDPSGGGPRSLYGGQFVARTDLPTWSDSIEALSNFNPAINNWMMLGADLRVLHTDAQKVPSNADRIMQGAIHLTVQLSQKYTLYISKDWNLDYQAAGIANILPMDGYLKIGRFLPTFGLRPDDHTMYIRDGLFGSPTYSDVGLEIGFHPQRWEFAAAVLSGSAAPVNDNKAYAFSVRTSFRFNVGALDMMLGGSAYGDEYIGGDNDQFWYGPFYGLHLGRVTVMGEFDLTRDLPASISSGSPSHNPVGLVASQMAFVKIFQGCRLRAGYDFQDYDIDWKTGSRQRYTGGAQWFPYGFLEFQANLRLTRTESAAGTTSDQREFDAQVHLFF